MCTNEDWNPVLEADRTYAADELLVWQSESDGVRLAVLPAHMSTAPNPALTNGRVAASIFSPGKLQVFDAQQGDTLWSLSLGKYGGRPPLVGDGLLHPAGSSELFAVDPANGRTVWSYSPEVDGAETFYSSPVILRRPALLRRPGRLPPMSRRGYRGEAVAR